MEGSGESREVVLIICTWPTLPARTLARTAAKLGSNLRLKAQNSGRPTCGDTDQSETSIEVT